MKPIVKSLQKLLEHSDKNVREEVRMVTAGLICQSKGKNDDKETISVKNFSNRFQHIIIGYLTCPFSKVTNPCNN